ncbi:MAG TPA: ABC transporter permease subunit [Candidatus Dormibacteraeota bacterium]|nr:ABC transporter permease subunit [Candidatus Dormibacteraeota bacterium]
MNRSRRLNLRLFRAVILVLAGAFFLLPIAAMFEFSTRGNSIGAPRTLVAWSQIAQTPGLVSGIVVSLELAVITSVGMMVLLLPTMVWVRLRLQRLSRILEFVCLLPLVVPAIALVVGLKPIFIWIEINVTPSTLGLAFAYPILVLPYGYRTLDAGLASIDLRTLSEAARSLGAGWATVILRVVIPNMPTAILNATLLSVALVLGEYTVANLLNYQNMQVEIAYVGLTSAGTSIAVAVASLLFTFLLLFLLSIVGRALSRRTRTEEILPSSASAAGIWGQRV